MKLRNIINKFRYTPKRVKLLLTGAITTGLLVSGAVVYAGWTPSRPVLDWNNPADRTGSMTGPVFNSFINTPYYGDERAFFDARRTDQNQFKDVLPNVTEGSKEVVLRTYVHNNANQTTNASGAGIAKNTRVRIDLPNGTEKALRMRSYITADNATPQEVTDTTELVDDTPFSIQYIPGSAIVYNSAHNGGVALSDNIVTSGAPLGYNQMDGNFPGCFEFQAIVEIRVKVVTPNISIQKQVKKAGTDNWQKMTEVQPGDKVQWLLDAENTGNIDLDHMQISDQLPPHVALVPGSVRYIYVAQDGSTQDVAQGDGPLFTTGGIDVGTYHPGGGFYIRFDTTAKDDFEDCEVTIRNLGFIRSTQTPNEISDYADVKIKKENCNPVKPVVSCDMLSAQSLGGRSFRYTVTYTAQNATFKMATYNFGDNSTPLVTDKTTVDHTYAQDGEYRTKVVLTFTVDGKDQEVTSDACATTVSTSTPPENCPIPGKTNLPKNSPECTLPNTGAGDIVGIFAATTAAATLAHKFVFSRKRGY